MCLCAARTEKVGRGVAAVEQAYHRDLTVRELKHDMDIGIHMVSKSKEGT